MKARVLLFGAATLSVLSGCAQEIDDGRSCFQSSECHGGSVCTETVYGDFCMEECSIEVVLCEQGEACLRASSSGFGGSGGVGGAGGRGGAGGEGGAGGAGGEDDLWVCLPGAEELDADVLPRDLGQLCDYSLDCIRGGVCVCIPGATCSGEGRNGPTCQRLCDPTEINDCPRIVDLQPECTSIGDGRGFCDPTTLGETDP